MAFVNWQPEGMTFKEAAEHLRRAADLLERGIGHFEAAAEISPHGYKTYTIRATWAEQELTPTLWRKGQKRLPIIDWENYPERIGGFDPEGCAAATLSNDLGHKGKQCGLRPAPGERYCWIHGGKRVSEVKADTRRASC